MAPKPPKPGKKPPKGSGTPAPPRAQTDAAGSSTPTSARSTSAPSSAAPPSPVDVGAIARALSAGFLILVFGGLIQPVVSRFAPQVFGMFWLILVAVIAFAVAGVRAGMTAPNPPLYGAGTAVGSFVLVVPLLFVQSTFNPVYAFYNVVAAAVIGAIAGKIGARSQAGKDADPTRSSG